MVKKLLLALFVCLLLVNITACEMKQSDDIKRAKQMMTNHELAEDLIFRTLVFYHYRLNKCFYLFRVQINPTPTETKCTKKVLEFMKRTNPDNFKLVPKKLRQGI